MRISKKDLLSKVQRRIRETFWTKGEVVTIETDNDHQLQYCVMGLIGKESNTLELRMVNDGFERFVAHSDENDIASQNKEVVKLLTQAIVDLYPERLSVIGPRNLGEMVDVITSFNDDRYTSRKDMLRVVAYAKSLIR